MRMLCVLVSMLMLANSSAFAGSELNLFVDQLRNGDIPQEAVQTESDEREPSQRDILASAYSLKTLLTKALEDSRSLPMGPRIQFFVSRTEAILNRDTQSPTERFAVLALQRSQEIVKVAIEIAGNNPELIAQWIANFYRTSFELAVSLINNPLAVRSANGAIETSEYLKSVSLAQFGYFYSTMLWRNSSNVTSDTAKAVILLKIVSYLGQDFNSDLRRREPRFKEVIADIYYLQKEDLSYGRVVRALQEMQEPQSTDLAALRVKVYKIWTSLASKLNETGVQTKFTER